MCDGENDDDERIIYWADVLVPVEYKNGEDGLGMDLEIDIRLAFYARKIFTAQPFRRFVLALGITEGKFMRLWRYDRSGPVYSVEIDKSADPEQATGIIRLLGQLSLEDMGFDPTIEVTKPVLDSPDDTLSLRVQLRHKAGRDDFYEVTRILHVSRDNLAGRGTLVMEIRLPGAEVEVSLVVKEQWLHVVREERISEIEKLKALREKNIPGLVTIASQYPQQRSVKFTPLSDPRNPNSPIFPLVDSTWEGIRLSDAGTKPRTNRRHVRHVLDQSGRPLSEITTVEELCKVVTDVAEGESLSD